MGYFVEITGYNLTAAAVQTLRFALGAGIAFGDTTYCPSGVVSWRAPSQKIDIGRAGAVELGGDDGELVIANYPDATSAPGPNDALVLSWAWLNRRANFYYVPGLVYASRILISTGILQQPVAEVAADRTLQSTIRFPLRDPRSLLTGPLQPTKYPGQQENLIPYSQQFNTYWGLGNIGVLPNVITAPDGTFTGSKLVEAATTAAHYIQGNGGTVVSGAPYTGSVYLRAAERPYAQVMLYQTNGHYAGFTVNLVVGSVTSWGNIISINNYTVTPVGNGWWRVTVSIITDHTDVALLVAATDAFYTSWGAPYLGIVSTGIHAWGAQINYGLIAKPYAVTAGAAATGNDIDGDADVKGKPKPIVYGTVSNVLGVRISQSKLMWQVADKSVSVLCVRDGGAPLTLGTVRATLASIQTNTPTPGTYDSYSGVEGTFIRLGTKPVRQITIDAQEAATRTNYYRYSEDLTNVSYWGLAGATIAGNAAVAPDGANTADKIIESATTASHYAYTFASPVADGRIAQSVYVKAAGRTAALVQMTDNVTGSVYIALNLTTGAVLLEFINGSWTNFGYNIEDVGSGWWRVTLVATKGAGTFIDLIVGPADSVGSNYYAGNGTDGIYVWGSQLERNPMSTGYIGTLGADFTVYDEGARNHAQVWNRMRQERCATSAGDINFASIRTCENYDAHEVGFYFDEEITQLDALNAVLTSFSGYEVQGWDLKWKIAKLIAPSGLQVVSIRPIYAFTQMVTLDRPMRSLRKARPTFAPNGAPPYRVTVRWGRNHNVMDPSEFVGGASQRLKDKFATEWRSEVATNTAIWNPVTGVGPWPNAPELVIETGYQPGPDSLSCPHAATEAARLLALYSALPGQYEVAYIPETTDRLLPGDVVAVYHGQMSLAGGAFFRVFQTAIQADAQGIRYGLVVGLQA